ncbi:MAG TPA: hypothetical protein VF677_12650 [Flavobacterium sp.]|jgi:hypothetical protein
MRQSFVKKSSNAFFENKKATVLIDIQNIGGDIIIKGSQVIITGKNSRNKEWLNVKLGSIEVNGVDPESLELIKEPETWPIENDTLDIKEHEFKL